MADLVCEAEQEDATMGWSIKLFAVAGTAVRIHLTFFLLLAWIGWAIYVTSENGADAGLGVGVRWVLRRVVEPRSTLDLAPRQ